MGYPVVTAGLVMGRAASERWFRCSSVGRMMGKFDTRMLLMVGLGLTAWAMYDMTELDARCFGMDDCLGRLRPEVRGLASCSVPLTTVPFATLPPAARADGTGLYNLSRNIGSSVGISVVSYLLTRNGQINHELIGAHVTATNRAFENGAAAQMLSPLTASGRAALDQLIQFQGRHHQLYRRFQADDDPVARRDSPGSVGFERRRRPREATHAAVME